jgi:hypothetical protein
VSKDALTPNLEAETFEVDVVEAADGSDHQLIRNLIEQEDGRASTSERQRHIAHDLVQKLIEIEDRVYLLDRLLQKQELLDTLIGRTRCASISGHRATMLVLSAVAD